MTGLGALIAKQKAEREKANDGTAKAEVAATPSGTDNPNPTGSPAPTVGGRLRFGVKSPAPATAGSPESTKPVEPKPASPAPAPVAAESVAPVTLDDIESDESEYEVKRASEYAFPDEMPATAPDRDLPADLDASQKSFVASVNSIYEIMHDPELFGQMIRTIMQEMQEHPDYIKLMADQDVHVMIRGLRDSMGLARIKKADKATKARGSKKAPASAAMAGTLDEIFNSDDW